MIDITFYSGFIGYIYTMNSTQPVLTISVAANLLNTHPRTLMLYERIGIFTPHRTGTQRRMFSLKDLEELQFIRFLTQEQGINLKGVKFMLEALSLAQKGGIDLKKLLFPTFKSISLV